MHSIALKLDFQFFNRTGKAAKPSAKKNIQSALLLAWINNTWTPWLFVPLHFLASILNDNWSWTKFFKIVLIPHL